jgi:hypothetical protein
MENQIIKVDNLLVGDEVIYASNGSLRRVRITRPLVASKKRYSGHYSSSKVDIMNVYNLDDQTVVRTMYQDLNYNDLWLIKRETI